MMLNMLNMLNLLKGDLGAYVVSVEPNTVYDLSFDWYSYVYYFYNKKAAPVEITFEDGTMKIFKNSVILMDKRPVKIEKLSLAVSHNYDSSKEYVIDSDAYKSVMDVKRTACSAIVNPIPKALKTEIDDGKEYEVTDANINYLYAVPLDAEYLDYVNIIISGDNVRLENKLGEHLMTFLKSSYCHTKGLIYCDSWSYVKRSIIKLGNKVQTVSQRREKEKRNDLNQAIRELGYLTNNPNLDIDVILYEIRELNKCLPNKAIKG